MYCEAFELRDKPFSLAADPRFLYMSPQHWEAMAHLMYGVDDDWGFVLITGEIGTGKTTLCRFLLDQLAENVEVAFLINPKIMVEELLASICDEFRINRPASPTGTRELFDLISARLLEIHGRGHKALLIIDEAQYLSAEVLDHLRLLTNLETADGKLLRIILLGQPELREMLARPELEQMSQRITARYHLGPLAEEDILAYVTHRMALAGAQQQYFSPSAMKALIRISRGVPRLINVICDRALLGSCMKKEKVVSRATLLQAGREVMGDDRLRNYFLRRMNMRWAGAGIATGLLVALIAILLYSGVMSRHSTGPGGTAGSGLRHAEELPGKSSSTAPKPDMAASLPQDGGKENARQEQSPYGRLCSGRLLLSAACRDILEGRADFAHNAAERTAAPGSAGRFSDLLFFGSDEASPAEPHRQNEGDAGRAAQQTARRKG